MNYWWVVVLWVSAAAVACTLIRWAANAGGRSSTRLPPYKILIGDSIGVSNAYSHNGKVSKLLWLGHDMPPAGNQMHGWTLILDGRRGTVVGTTALTVTVCWDD